MSSRIAVCGQQPVSTATIRSIGSTPAARSASASSVVKMSLVTTTIESSSRSSVQSAPTRVVLPLPTGPPTPTRSARSPGRAVGVVMVTSDGCRGRRRRGVGHGRCLRVAGARQATNSRWSQVPWCSPRISVRVPPAPGSALAGRDCPGRRVGDQRRRPRRQPGLQRRAGDRVEAEQAHGRGDDGVGEVVDADRRRVVRRRRRRPPPRRRARPAGAGRRASSRPRRAPGAATRRARPGRAGGRAAG